MIFITITGTSVRCKLPACVTAPGASLAIRTTMQTHDVQQKLRVAWKKYGKEEINYSKSQVLLSATEKSIMNMK